MTSTGMHQKTTSAGLSVIWIKNVRFSPANQLDLAPALRVAACLYVWLPPASLIRLLYLSVWLINLTTSDLVVLFPRAVAMETRHLGTWNIENINLLLPSTFNNSRSLIRAQARWLLPSLVSADFSALLFGSICPSWMTKNSISPTFQFHSKWANYLKNVHDRRVPVKTFFKWRLLDTHQFLPHWQLTPRILRNSERNIVVGRRMPAPMLPITQRELRMEKLTLLCFAFFFLFNKM